MRTALVVGTLIMVAVGTDRLRWMVQRGNQPETFRTLAVGVLTQHPQQIFVGSSHVYTSIDPAEFRTSTVSIAESALDYRLAERLVERHWRAVRHAACVVVELDSVLVCEDTLALRGGDLNELWEWGLTGTDLPFNPWFQMQADLDRVCGCSRYPPLLPGLRKSVTGDDLRPGFVGRRQPIRPSQYRPFFQALDRPVETATVERNLAALLRLTRSLQEVGVRVVLLRTPHHPGYWSHPVGRRLETYAEQALARVQQEFGNSTPPVIDLRFMPELGDTDFSDWSHLSTSGAVKFSRRLDKLLEH